MQNKTLRFLLVLLVLAPTLVWASGGSSGFSEITLLLVLLLTVAKWLGFVFERMGVPELVGELCAGLMLGNLGLLGFDFDVAQQLLDSQFVQFAAEMGVIILLFLVGLESNMRDLIKVGPNAGKVAAVGVVLPVLLGLAVASGLGFTSGISSWFVGATLAATSVGITAKVLGEAGLIKSPSSQVILGAAVIDDILGILLLAVLAGVVTTGSVSALGLSIIVVKAAGFFVVSFFIGQLLFPRLVMLTSMNDKSSFWTAFAFILALGFAELASFAGLAPIIGAFTAGLLLEDVHFIVGHKLQKETLEHLLKPITDILLPIFFVAIGAQVKLDVLGDWKAIGIVLILLVVAVLSKGVSGFFVKGDRFHRLGIGIGMIPRGEVGLIFAAYALKHKVFTSASYSILVVVVLLSTILGPIALKPHLKDFAVDD